MFWKSRRLVSTSDRKFNHSRGTTYFWETSSTWNRMWVDFWDRYMIMKIGENLVHDCKQYSAPQAKILGFKSIISVWKRCKTAENFAYNFHISESKDTKESRSDSLVSEYPCKWVEKITRKNDDDSLVSEYPCKCESTVQTIKISLPRFTRNLRTRFDLHLPLIQQGIHAVSLPLKDQWRCSICLWLDKSAPLH